MPKQYASPVPGRINAYSPSTNSPTGASPKESPALVTLSAAVLHESRGGYGFRAPLPVKRKSCILLGSAPSGSRTRNNNAGLRLIRKADRAPLISHVAGTAGLAGIGTRVARSSGLIGPAASQKWTTSTGRDPVAASVADKELLDAKRIETVMRCFNSMGNLRND
jgi:hypothetical protein